MLGIFLFMNIITDRITHPILHRPQHYTSKTSTTA
jgi:hypothetical protein